MGYTERKLSKIDFSRTIVIEYKRYFEIIKLYNVANVLMTLNPAVVAIPVITEKFMKDGGFRTIYDKWIQEQKEVKEIEKLQMENLKLSNENFEYQQTIRNQEQKIRDLTETNTTLNIIKSALKIWWLILPIVGYILGKAIELLIKLIPD